MCIAVPALSKLEQILMTLTKSPQNVLTFYGNIPFSVQISQQCMREVKRAAIQSQKTMKDTPSRARRLTREMLVYWKRFEKVEKEHRKRVEKEAIEKRKLDLELSEVGQCTFAD